jgi:NAD(P)-dependent dehydrogenase (short-subunit alcohol dehydrogenase family)
VVGASRGIGLGISQLFAELGSNVLLVSRREHSLAAAAEHIQQTGRAVGKVSYQAGRADSDDDARACVSSAIERYGAVDILVNNAATNPYFGPLVGISRGQAEKTLSVNLWGPPSWVQSAWDQWMSGHGGSILNISSTSGFAVDANLGWYGATKAGLVQVTRQLAMELAPKVRVNAIAPGLIKTELSRALWENGEKGVAAMLPLQRLGTTEDIAEAAAFLCSDAASWITGHTLVVDGGYLLHPAT